MANASASLVAPDPDGPWGEAASAMTNPHGESALSSLQGLGRGGARLGLGVVVGSVFVLSAHEVMEAEA